MTAPLFSTVYDQPVNLEQLSPFVQERYSGHEALVTEVIHALEDPMKPLVVLSNREGLGKTAAVAETLHHLNEERRLAVTPVWLDGSQAGELMRHLYREVFQSEPVGHGSSLVQALAERLLTQPLLVILDSFDQDVTVAATRVTAQLLADWSPEVVSLLETIRGGPSKVVVICRDGAPWAPTRLVYTIDVQPINGAALTGLIENEISAHSIEALPGIAMAFLTGPMGGNLHLLSPLMACLAETTRVQSQGEVNEMRRVHGQIFADPAHVVPNLSDIQHHYLPLLALFYHHIDVSVMEDMLKHITVEQTGSHQHQGLLDTLVTQRLLMPIKMRRDGVIVDLPGIYRIPIQLTDFLRTQIVPRISAEAQASLEVVFAAMMAQKAESLMRRPMHEQENFFRMLAESLENAMQYAHRHGMSDEYAALSQACAWYALKDDRPGDAASHFMDLLCDRIGQEDERGSAAAFSYLGEILLNRQQFLAAEQCCFRSLQLDHMSSNMPGLLQDCDLLIKIAEACLNEAGAAAWTQRKAWLEDAAQKLR